MLLAIIARLMRAAVWASYLRKSCSVIVKKRRRSKRCRLSVDFAENEEVYDAVVESRCFRAYCWNSKLDVHVFRAGRF